MSWVFYFPFCVHDPCTTLSPDQFYFFKIAELSCSTWRRLWHPACPFKSRSPHSRSMKFIPSPQYLSRKEHTRLIHSSRSAAARPAPRFLQSLGSHSAHMSYDGALHIFLYIDGKAGNSETLYFSLVEYNTATPRRPGVATKTNIATY